MKNQVNKLFQSKVAVLNVGLEVFWEAVNDQGITAIQVEWKPAAGGNVKLISILNKLRTF